MSTKVRDQPRGEAETQRRSDTRGVREWIVQHDRRQPVSRRAENALVGSFVSSSLLLTHCASLFLLLRPLLPLSLLLTVLSETYLTMWNNTTNPKEISCRTAFDILCWCFGPVSQVRSLYRTGQTTLCSQQWSDMQLCLKVKAQAMKDPEEARVSSSDDSDSKQQPTAPANKHRQHAEHAAARR